jgi:hypothetical protein
MAYSYQLDRCKELHGSITILEEVYSKIFSNNYTFALHDHQWEEFPLAMKATTTILQKS